MGKLSLRPTSKPSVEDFVREASEKPDTEDKPWELPHVREDLIKAVSFRLSEPYLLKLAYLSEVTNKSQQQILREIVLPALDEMVEKY